MFLRTAKGDFQRICFSNLPLTEQEVKQWQGFIAFCKEKNLALPPEYLTYESMVLRYLQATKWDYQKTFDAIIIHQQWTLNDAPHIPPT